MITQRLLIPRPTTLKTRWYAVFNPFHYKLWLLIVLTTFVSAIVLYALVKMYNKFQESSKSNISILSELFVIIGILLLGNFPSSKSYSGPARPFVSLWTVHSLLVVTAYSSCLVAHLTSPLFNKQLSSLEAIVENGYVWSSAYEVHDSLLFNDDKWHAKFLEQFVLETSEDTRELLIETGKYVFHAKSFDEKFIIVDVDRPFYATLNSYEASEFYLKQFFVSFAFRKGTYYAKPFNMYLLRFHSTGNLQKILGDLFYVEGLKHPYVINAFKKHPKSVQGPTKLEVINLIGAFFVLAIGLILAAVIFLVEHVFQNMTLNVSQYPY